MQYGFYQKKDVRVLLMFIHTYDGILKRFIIGQN